MAEECSPGQTQELSVTTPLGSFSTKGSKRMGELIAALALILGFLIAYALYEHKIESAAYGLKLSEAIKDLAQSQRELTCIISLPQERREQEYRSPMGLCKRLGTMQ